MEGQKKHASTSRSTRLRSERSGTSTARFTSAVKRDSLAAELEKDPQLSTAKRQQRSQVFTSTVAQASLERQLASAQTTRMELEVKLRDREMKIESLERDRIWLADSEKEQKVEREKERCEYQEKRTQLELELKSLRTTLSDLREVHADLLDSHQAISYSHAQLESVHNSVASTLTSKSNHLETSLEESRNLLSEHVGTISDLRAQIEELTSRPQNCENLAIEDNDMGIVRQELQRQVDYLRDLERANTNLQGELNVLRSKSVSIEVLREEKHALELKVSRSDELREQVSQLEAEVDAARRERETWASNNSVVSGTSVELTKAISELRLSHARLLEDHGVNKALLCTQKAEVTSLSEKEASACRRVECLESEVANLRNDLERKDGKIRIAKREIGFLEAMVASYTMEQDQEPDGAKEHTQHDAPVEQLQGVLEEYKMTNERLMQDLDDASSRDKAISSAALQDEKEKVSKLEEALSTAQAQILADRETIRALEFRSQDMEKNVQKLEDANEDLEQTLHDLKGEIAGGRHVPPGVRVLCMQQNPVSEWMEMRKEAVDSLKRENEALMGRCEELEKRLWGLKNETDDQNVGESGERMNADKGITREDLVPRASWEQAKLENQELQLEVGRLDKRLSRLKQIFKSKADEFREAVTTILGVKLAFSQNGNVTVSSVYDTYTSFVFQPIKAGEKGARMQLLAKGEGGPQDIPSLMEFWIGKEECLPGFIASVTLECYEYRKKRGPNAE